MPTIVVFKGFRSKCVVEPSRGRGILPLCEVTKESSTIESEFMQMFILINIKILNKFSNITIITTNQVKNGQLVTKKYFKMLSSVKIDL